MSLVKKNNFGFFVGFGAFLTDVYAFEVVDIQQGYEIDISIYKGPFNLFTVSNQRFLTAGVLGRTGVRLKKGKNFYSFNLDAGLGPNKTSFASLGISAGGLLRKAK